ncbi:MAG: glycerol-3-phosphate acyltransferase [Armatimonadota bacterium]
MTTAGSLAAMLAVLAAAVLGSIPTGYLAGRWLRGIDVRRLSPHNLGMGAVVAAAGLPALAAAVSLDVIKGSLAVVIASRISPSDMSLAASAAAVVIGHAYSPFWLVIPPAFARVMGVAASVGAAAAIAALGAIPWAALAVPAAVAVVVLAAPRLLGRRWGYLSLANVLAAVSAPVALWMTGARIPYVLLGLAFAVATLWNHKEHLARIIDGTEPRLGDRLPVPHLDGEEVVCAFLIHPMTIDDVWEARRFRWLAPLRRRGLVSDRAIRWLARVVRPMKVDDIHPVRTADGRRARVYLIGVPLLPDQIRALPALAVHRAVQAAHLAANLGATVLGLGAYWSVVGNKGIDVQAQSSIAITNGGAYTAGTVRMAVPLVLDRLRAGGRDPSRTTAAVVGANGVVGFGICRAVVEHVGRLIMLGTSQERLDQSRDLLRRRYPSAVIDATTSLNTLREADIIFTATSEPAPVVFPEHVRPGSIIFDLGRPYDVDASVAAMDGVDVIPGGVVRLPGDPRGRLDMGYGSGLVPACLAETVIIALDQCYERVSLGDRTKNENVDFFVARAAAFGFEVQTTGRRTAVPEAPSPVYTR